MGISYFHVKTWKLIRLQVQIFPNGKNSHINIILITEKAQKKNIYIPLTFKALVPIEYTDNLH